MLLDEIFSDSWLTNDERAVLTKLSSDESPELTPYEQLQVDRMKARGILTGEELKPRTIDPHWRF